MFFFLRALSLAWLNVSALHLDLAWDSFGNHRSKWEKLCSCKSCWFLPGFLKWNGAVPPSLSWLIRENVAIFSLVLLKCGCKKLLVQPEKDGSAASDRGGPPHCLPQPTSHISGAWRSRLARGISLLPAVSQLPGCWGRYWCCSLKPMPSLKWFDRSLWSAWWAWSLTILETWDRMGLSPALRFFSTSVSYSCHGGA